MKKLLAITALFTLVTAFSCRKKPQEQIVDKRIVLQEPIIFVEEEITDRVSGPVPPHIAWNEEAEYLK